jgi:two-component system chemotaxis response regulator CheB
MPSIRRSEPDHVARLADLPALLASLVRKPAGQPMNVPAGIDYDVEIARSGARRIDPMDKICHMDKFGKRSVLACPDCGGVMWELVEGDVVRYRCHVGHAYTAGVMSVALDDSLRRAFASAQRALEERIAIAQSLQTQAINQGRTILAEIWAERAEKYSQEAEVIRSSMSRADELAAKFARTNSAAGR